MDERSDLAGFGEVVRVRWHYATFSVRTDWTRDAESKQLSVFNWQVLGATWEDHERGGYIEPMVLCGIMRWVGGDNMQRKIVVSLSAHLHHKKEV